MMVMPGNLRKPDIGRTADRCRVISMHNPTR